MFHVPSQLQRDGLLIDAFVIERKHLSVKALADKIKNTRAFEGSVMSGVVFHQLRHTQQSEALSCLRGAVRQVGSVLLASHMSFLTLQISVGDLVLYGEEVGEVLSCLELLECPQTPL